MIFSLIVVVHLGVVYAATCGQLKDTFKGKTTGGSCCGAPSTTVRGDINVYDTTMCALPYDVSSLGSNSLDVVMLGIGSPVETTRGQYSYVVYAGDMQFVVDAGDNSAVLARGQPAIIDYSKLKNILVTHFHSDHIADLPSHKLNYNIASQDEPLEVIGPVGMCDVVDGVNLMFKNDGISRKKHHNQGKYETELIKEASLNLTCREFEVPASPTTIFEQSGVKISTFEVDHRPVYPAVGYRFEYKGRSVVFLGDSVYYRKAVEGIGTSDVVVATVLDDDVTEQAAGVAASVQPLLARVFDDIIEYHANPHSLARMIQETNVKHWILTHIIPAGPPIVSRNFAEENLLNKTLSILQSDALTQHIPSISIAQQLAMIHLPSESTSVDVSRGSERPMRACEAITDAFLQPLIEFDNVHKALLYSIAENKFDFNVSEFIVWMQQMNLNTRPFSILHVSTLPLERLQSEEVVFNDIKTTPAYLFTQQLNLSQPVVDVRDREALVFTFHSSSAATQFQNAIYSSHWTNAFLGTETNIADDPFVILNPIIGSEMMFRRVVSSDVGFVLFSNYSSYKGLSRSELLRMHIDYVMNRKPMFPNINFPDPLPMIWATAPRDERTFFIEMFPTLSGALEHGAGPLDIGPSPMVNLPNGRPSAINTYVKDKFDMDSFASWFLDTTFQFLATPISNLNGNL